MHFLKFKKRDVSLYLKTESEKALELVLHVFQQPGLTKVKTLKESEIIVEFGCDESNPDNGWWVKDTCKDQNVNKKNLQVGDFIFYLSDRLVFHCADKIRSAHCLHAAAVVHNDLSIIIPAKSGSGKSSLTCWLLSKGFDYVTDELILIDESASFESVLRPIQIKRHGIEAIEPLINDREEVYSGKVVNALGPAVFGSNVSQKKKHKLSLFLFPQYKAKSKYEFKRLSSAEAGLVLMGNNVNARNHPTHGFKELMSLVRSTPAYALNYGGFDQLPDDFIEQLISICTEQ